MAETPLLSAADNIRYIVAQHQQRLRKRDSSFKAAALQYQRMPGCEGSADSRNILVAALDAETADAIAKDPAVEFVEQDYVVPVEVLETEATASLAEVDPQIGFDLKKTNTWHLDRLDQRKVPLDGASKLFGRG